jgi:anaerobic selenocysteine-containing dehydrogenase
MNEEPQRKTFFGGCPHDCPDTCAMIYEVEDGRLIEVRGNKEHPMTRGRLCVKLKDYHDHHYNPDRVLYPLRRTGPKGSRQFTRISWDEAITEITARWKDIIARYGSQAIMPYSYLGNEGLVQGLTAGDAFFNCLGSTVNEKTFCASGSSTAWLLTVGPTGGVDPESFVHSRYIVIWACNSISTNLHHWPFVLEARKRGAKVVVIDSYRSRTAKQADWHIMPKPGTDGAFAMGVIAAMIENGLVDREWVDNHTVGFEELAERAKEFTPAYVEHVTGVPAAYIARFCPRLRQSPTFRHPHGRGARAARRWRPDHSRRVCDSCARRLMASCRRRIVADAALGVPGGLGARVAARFHQAGHAGGEQPPARSGANRRDAARSADHGPLHLQHQPGEPGTADEQDRERLVARGSVLRDGRALRHRYGGLRRYRAAGDHGRRA